MKQQRVFEAKLRLGTVFQQQFVALRRGHADDRVTARANDGRADFGDQRTGDGVAGDADDIAFLNANRIPDQHVGQLPQSRIIHVRRPSSDFRK